MPKTEKIYTKNINVRISMEQFKKWDVFAKDNGFDDISKLVRYATDGLIEGILHKNKLNNRTESLQQEIKDLNKKYSELIKTQSDILKVIAKKSSPTPEVIPYKQLIINLLQEKPRDEEELSRIFDNLSEVEILSILNELLETSIIKQVKDKYKVM